MKRVVVTGMAGISPLGNELAATRFLQGDDYRSFVYGRSDFFSCSESVGKDV